VTFTDCVFFKNQNDDPLGQGGAIGAFQATVACLRCTFDGNQCGGEGGAISVDGGSLTLVDCDLHDNQVGNNSLYAVSGGAIRARYGATVDVERTTFAANGSSPTLGSTGCYGGAISSYQSTVTAVDCTFSDNDADQGKGGALDGDGFAATGCSFERNV